MKNQNQKFIHEMLLVMGKQDTTIIGYTHLSTFKGEIKKLIQTEELFTRRFINMENKIFS